MNIARTSATGLAITAILAGALAGCSNDSDSSSPSTASSKSSTPSTVASASSAAESPSQTQPGDYTALLIEASDVGPEATAPEPPVLNPNGVPGVAQLFASPDGSHRVGDTILVFADPAAAAKGLENAKGAMGSEVTGSPQPIDVGSNGTMVAGNSPDNSKAVTLVMFTRGSALVNLQFESAPNDPIVPEAALDIAKKQDAAVQNGLPG
jgi:hypothetical protein